MWLFLVHTHTHRHTANRLVGKKNTESEYAHVPTTTHTHAIQNTFGSCPQCIMCVFTRLVNYPCGEKDKGQSEATVGDENIISLHGLCSNQQLKHVMFPCECVRVWSYECFYLCSIISARVTDGALALKKGNGLLSWRKTLRKILLSFSCWGKDWQVATDWWCIKESLGEDDVQSALSFSGLQDSAIVYVFNHL